MSHTFTEALHLALFCSKHIPDTPLELFEIELVTELVGSTPVDESLSHNFALK